MAVPKIELYGLKINEEITSGTDLAELIVEEARRQIGGIEDGDVIVITSKVVSKAEGRMARLDDVIPSMRARALSRIYGKDARLIELILREGDVIYVIPIYKLARRYGHLYREYAFDRGKALEVVSRDPCIFMTSVRGYVLTDAGIDFSNAPEGFCTMLPRDPDESARRIREGIRRLTGKDVAVVIADTEWKFDKFGSIDVAVGSSGILPVARRFGAPDRFGRPKFGGVDNIVDLLSAAAALLFGQTDESVPVVVVRGLKYERSEKGVRDVLYPVNILRKAIKLMIWEYVKFKILIFLIGVACKLLEIRSLRTRRHLKRL